jgi:hypothetical protein
MRPPVTQRPRSGLHDVGGSGEIRLANLQVNDLFASCFQFAGAYQHFESALCAQPRHALGQANRLLRDCTHSDLSSTSKTEPPVQASKRS